MADTFKADFTKQTAKPNRGGKNPRPLLKRFSPYDLDDEQVIRQATGRTSAVQSIMQAIRDNLSRNQAPNQHLLVLGPRGMGKSFLVRMIQISVQEMIRAGSPLAFVRLSEEQNNVSAPELLLDEIRRILCANPPQKVRAKWRSGGEAEWKDSLAALKTTLADHAGLSDDQGLLVVSIENFDILLEDVFRQAAAQSRLRDLLASEPRLMLLATATKPADDKASKRLFQNFRRLLLQPWEPKDFVEFYRKTFTPELKLNTELSAKIKALAHFMGGSPRLAVLLGDILNTNDALSAVETLDQLVDELTPYYQDRIMTRLKPKARWLLDELLRGGEPCSQTELAKRVSATSQPDIAQDFGTLQRDGIVSGDRGSTGANKRKILYRVTDRVFAHFYRKRYLADDAHSPLATMVDFLESFYNEPELVDQAIQLATAGRLDEARVFIKALQHTPEAWRSIDQSSRVRDCRRLLEFVWSVLESNDNNQLLQLCLDVKDKLGLRKTPDVIQLAEQAQSLAKTPTDKVALAIMRSTCLLTIPHAEDRAISVLQDILPSARKLKKHGILYPLALYVLALAEAYIGKQDEADEHFNKASILAIGHGRLYVSILSQRLCSLVFADRFDEALADFDEAVNAAKAISDKSGLAWLYRIHGYIYWKKDDMEAVLQDSEQSVAFAKEAKDDVQLLLSNYNYSASLAYFERYDEALAAAQTAKESAKRTGDDNYMLDVIWREADLLLQASRPQETIDSIFTAMGLARKLENKTIEAKLHGLLSKAYQAVAQTEKALDSLREATEIALRNGDIDLISDIHFSLLLQLREDKQTHGEEIIDCFTRWTRQFSKQTQDDESNPLNQTPTPIWLFDDIAAAATFNQAWGGLIDDLTELSELMNSLPKSLTTIGEAIIELYQTGGPSPAFAAAAGFFRAVEHVTKQPSHDNGKLEGLLREWAAMTCSRLVSKLDHPGLLHDIAAEIRERLAADDVAKAMEGAALYHENKCNPAVLETIDPDIREAVSTLLGVNNNDENHARDPQETAAVGYPRVDVGVNAEQRATIAKALADQEASWAAPPLITAEWKQPDQAQTVDIIIAALGAAHSAIEISRAQNAFAEFMRGIDRFGILAAESLHNAQAVRTANLSFYPGWTLADIGVVKPDGTPAVLSILFNETTVVPILGVSEPIYELNASGALVIDHKNKAADYLRFFCNVIRGDDGPFRIIERIKDIPLSEPCTPEQASKLTKLIRLVNLRPHDKSSWNTKVLIQNSHDLFVANFIIHTSGMLDVVDGEVVMTLDTIKRERTESGLRFFDGVCELDDDAPP